MKVSHVISVGAVAAFCSCGGDSVGPVRAELHVLSGANVTDTVMSQSSLRIRVEGVSSGAVATFRVLGEAVQLGHISLGQVPTGQVQVHVDATGHASVPVRIGPIAGTSYVEVWIPALELSDTVTYVALPGTPVAARLMPRDTIVIVGSSVTYSSTTVDAYGNARDDPAVLSFSVGADVGTISGQTIVTNSDGSARIRSALTVNGVTLSDSVVLAAVPNLRLAWSTGAVHVGPVGAAATQTFTTGLAPSWDPTGPRIVYSSGGSSLRLQTLVGSAQTLTPLGVSFVSWPVFSPDGAWIYFHAEYASNRRRIYRIDRQGGSLQGLTDEVNAEAVTVAPDGNKIGYVSSGIFVKDLTTGLVTSVTSPADAVGPRWSPNGEWLAYTVGFTSQLNLVRPDGSGHRVVGQHSLRWGINWSPNSRWVVGSSSNSGRIVLVDVANGISIESRVEGSHPTWERP